jgi:hypothetical protein
MTELIAPEKVTASAALPYPALFMYAPFVPATPCGAEESARIVTAVIPSFETCVKSFI